MKTKTVQMSLVVERELAKLPPWKAMLYLDENGETSVYKMAKDLGWSTGKAHAVINSLIKADAVKARTHVQNNRVVKLVKLVSS